MKRRHRILFAAAVITVALVLGEALVWWASPSEYLYPRYQFSGEYGLLPFPNVTMVHGIPRRFQYRYTVGDMGCRGDVPRPGEVSGPAVVTLGDSYAFGMGVADGEEFPAVMRRALAGSAEVVNLGSPGWGLTQEIRRFVETGEAYDPGVVVLQFCSNDPDDNLANRVTRLEDGAFTFVSSENSLNWIKKYLSRSFVQRTQLYNFLRTRASRAVLARMARREEAQLVAAAPVSGGEGGPTAKERVHNHLLEAFAERLHADGRVLILISVDGQLGQFPGIERAVHDLDARGLLRYAEARDWLAGLAPYQSPEGHVWGTSAHAAIGEGLAVVVRDILAEAGSAPIGTNR
ncbi:MAG TPA: SGNH/GDSL hydrolase family protein [Candidatus Krumholzibacteria bacterium]|nr:SGNH/GDSL hydrolase family protein [Candidatus Krumholzibacteria bacterium]